MSCTNSLNRRLLWAIIRIPSRPSTILCSYQPDHLWTRTISSTSARRLPPTISFGAENDAVIENYAPATQQLQSRHVKRERASSRTTRVPRSLSSPRIKRPNPEFEITGYVDRSTPKTNVSQDSDTVDVPAAVAKTTAQSRTKNSAPTRKRNPRANDIPEDSELVEGEEAESQRKDREAWQIQKDALKKKFPQGWNPRKKLSPDAMDGIRELHEQDPEKYSTAMLADQFKVSPESIRRILKSKWQMKESPDKMAERRQRWAKRHDRIWDIQSELGLRPRRKKDKEVEDPDQFERDLQRRELLGNR